MRRFALTRALFWLGLSCSGISLTWKLWDISGQAWWLVAAGLSGVILGVLAAGPAGLMADRLPRRTVMAASLILAAVAQLGLAAAATPVAVFLVGQAALMDALDQAMPPRY